MKHTKIVLSAILTLVLALSCFSPMFALAVAPQDCEHVWVWVTDINPTCTQPGRQHQYCNNCKSVQNENTPIEPTGVHSWIWVTDTEPTCGAAGTQHQYCPSCGGTQSEGTPIAPTARHTWEWVTDHEPTCGQPGTKHEHCAVCGRDRSIGTSVPATGEHNWQDAGIIENPTCARSGSKKQICSVCGSSRAVNLDRVDHVDADGNGQCDTCGVSMPGSNGGMTVKELMNKFWEFFNGIWERLTLVFSGKLFQ